MNPFPIEKYTFVVHDVMGKDNRTVKEVIAISSYAGKSVKGTAKCDPDDTFDFEKGKRLAAARCAFKIAMKRADRARHKVEEACERYDMAQEYLDNMNQYLEDSYNSLDKVIDELNNVLDEIKWR